ncbi:MAG: carboxymuconolactone decarboxylase family protein [Acidobacteria bacterium]|nr:carboxymuconolactone decarboxylase family protein [Acidobacteriota bacterium]
MTLDELRERLPEYAKDLKLNMSSVLRQPELTARQTWGTALACAAASHNDELLEVIAGEAREHLDDTAFQAALGAASVMGMNNVYYRFLHLSSNEKYSTMRAGLRMNVIRTHGSDPIDFELWCLAVSAINGCGACVDSHEKVVRDKGLGEDTVLGAVRIASVVHAVARVLDADAILAA